MMQDAERSGWAAEPERAPVGEMLEFYRVDAMRRMQRVLARGAGLMAIGAVVVGVSLITRQPEWVRIAASVVGAACVLGASLSTIVCLHRVLREEAYIALRTDVLEIVDEHARFAVAWDDLAKVRVATDGEGERIVLVARDGSERALVRAFSGTTRAALAQRLEEVRRKAQWNLLRSL